MAHRIKLAVDEQGRGFAMVKERGISIRLYNVVYRDTQYIILASRKTGEKSVYAVREWIGPNICRATIIQSEA